MDRARLAQVREQARVVMDGPYHVTARPASMGEAAHWALAIIDAPTMPFPVAVSDSMGTVWSGPIQQAQRIRDWCAHDSCRPPQLQGVVGNMTWPCRR